MTNIDPTAYIKCFWLKPVNEDEGYRLYERIDTGETMYLRDAPAGAMWDADWMKHSGVLLGGKTIHLVVRMPGGGDWMPGSESSNCTRKGEDHDCWCIHGTPPELTADKNPEPGRSTCQASAGSIQHGKWHGFLRNGYLVKS